MVKLKAAVQELLENLNKAVNPYKVLGINYDSSKYEVKQKFKEKMKEVRNDYSARADLCLADDIILNKQFYKESPKDFFYFDPNIKEGKNLCHYYAVIGDTIKFAHLVMNTIEKKDLIYFKDPSDRNLLYLAARNGHRDLCELIINFGFYDLNDTQYTGSTTSACCCILWPKRCCATFIKLWS